MTFTDWFVLMMFGLTLLGQANWPTWFVYVLVSLAITRDILNGFGVLAAKARK